MQYNKVIVVVKENNAIIVLLIWFLYFGLIQAIESGHYPHIS